MNAQTFSLNTAQAAESVSLFIDNTATLYHRARYISRQAAEVRGAGYLALAAAAGAQLLAELKGEEPDGDYTSPEVAALVASELERSYARKLAEEKPRPPGDFAKVVRLGARQPSWETTPFGVYAKIEFKGGRLSITGVEGPKSNGDARGGCGQIVMSLTEPGAAETWVKFAPGWDSGMVGLFLTLWDRWHLNDMNPATPEMRAAGWVEKAAKPIWLHKFTMTGEAIKAMNAAKAAALAALEKGETFTPTPEQTAAAAMPYEVTRWTFEGEEAPEPPPNYQRRKNISTGDVERPERKTLGWVKPTEHPEGLLGRKLTEDGPGYGSGWYREDVPAEVLDFLRSLPKPDLKPAWV